MNLSARISRLEREQPSSSNVVSMVATDRDDADRHEAAMRTSGVLRPEDVVVCILTGVPRSDDPVTISSMSGGSHA